MLEASHQIGNPDEETSNTLTQAFENKTREQICLVKLLPLEAFQNEASLLDYPCWKKVSVIASSHFLSAHWKGQVPFPNQFFRIKTTVDTNPFAKQTTSFTKRLE